VKIHIIVKFNAQSYAPDGRGGVRSGIREQLGRKCSEKQTRKTMKSSQPNFVNGWKRDGRGAQTKNANKK